MYLYFPATRGPLSLSLSQVTPTLPASSSVTCVQFSLSICPVLHHTFTQIFFVALHFSLMDILCTCFVLKKKNNNKKIIKRASKKSSALFSSLVFVFWSLPFVFCLTYLCCAFECFHPEQMSLFCHHILYVILYSYYLENDKVFTNVLQLTSDCIHVQFSFLCAE